jgi:hypothetical protein
MKKTKYIHWFKVCSYFQRILLLNSCCSPTLNIVPEFAVADLKFSKKKVNSIVHNLGSNALKHSLPDREPVIFVKTSKQKSIYCSR